jgi:hypothetical protein
LGAVSVALGGNAGVSLAKTRRTKGETALKNKKALAFCGDMGYNVSVREIVFLREANP